MKILLTGGCKLNRENMAENMERLAEIDSVLHFPYPFAIKEHLENLGDISLILYDHGLYSCDGITAIHDLRIHFPTPPMIMLSEFPSEHEARIALENGAQGYIPKNIGLRSMIGAIKLVVAGETYLPLGLLTKGERQIFPLPPVPQNTQSEGTILTDLTPREREVLNLLKDGSSNKEIARHLGLQEVTIKVHLRGVFRKLGVSNRTQAVRRLMELQMAQHLGETPLPHPVGT